MRERGGSVGARALRSALVLVPALVLMLGAPVRADLSLDKKVAQARSRVAAQDTEVGLAGRFCRQERAAMHARFAGLENSASAYHAVEVNMKDPAAGMDHVTAWQRLDRHGGEFSTELSDLDASITDVARCQQRATKLYVGIPALGLGLLIGGVVLLAVVRKRRAGSRGP